MSDNRPTLLADLGGTHARFALLSSDGTVHRDAALRTAEHGSFDDALGAYLAQAGVTPAAAALAVAGPIRKGGIELTNLGWTVSARAVAAAGVDEVLLVNDFTAVAAAAPFLDSGGISPIGGGERSGDAPLGVLGAGTGLGVSAAVADAGGIWQVLAGEGGHVTLAPEDELEDAVIARLRARFGHVSAERALSGEGLVNIEHALGEIEGGAIEAEPRTPAGIAERALRHGDGRARRTLALFTGWLGAVAGDLALTLGARGGIYLAGGIVPAWGEGFDRERFRRRFEAKGRFAGWLERVPCWLVTDPRPAFTGLRALADGRARATQCVHLGAR